MTDKQAREELRKRYTPPEIPKCSICGAELSIQRCGGGEPTVYACDGYEVDPENPSMVRRAAGRDIADKHYEESRYIDWKKGGDLDVVLLLDELEAAEHTAAVDHEAACSLVEENEEVKRKLAAAEKRIADYHRALNNLAAVARRYLPDYDEHPDIQTADDLLESAAGIGKGE